MLRFRNILKKSNLANYFNLLLEESEDWLRSLGKNDFNHSENIEQILDRLVPDQIKSDDSLFDHGEIYVLLAATYLHDIGRKADNEDHELASYYEIKNNYLKYRMPNQFVAEAVAQVCAAHAPESKWPISKCDNRYGVAGFCSSGKTLNLQVLGAMLRIADELDNSYRRVQFIPTQETSPRQFIRDVIPVPEKGIIEIQAVPGNWVQWNELQRIRNICQAKLSEVEKYLVSIGLNYYQVWLNPGEFYVPLSDDCNDVAYQDLVEVVASLVHHQYSSIDILVLIDDSEISILCTDKKLGLVTNTALMVRREVQLPMAHEIRGVLNHLKRNHKIDHGLVVVEQYPEDKVQELFAAQGYRLLSVQQLVNEVFDIHKVMKLYVKQYEMTPIFDKNLYISLNGTLEGGEDIANLEQFVIDWANSKQGIQLTILGDYGAGKTSLTEFITYTMAKQFLGGHNGARIPIHIKLKDLGVGQQIESVVTNILVNNLEIEMSFKSFNALNKDGRFLLILDGFDEMPDVSNEAQVLKGFRELDKLVQERSKVILTCRTHFFKNNVEIHNYHSGSVLFHSVDKKYGYNLLFINPFNKTQIEEYFYKWDQLNSSTYLNIIDNIYNLSDLATRPALLNIIAKTVPQLETRPINSINASMLYSIYIDFWLQRDDWRSNFTRLQRRELTDMLADYLFVNNKQTLHYAEIPVLKDSLLADGQICTVEMFDLELRTCSFLKRDLIGNYSFVHKSFLEFILAKSLFSYLTSSTEDIAVKWRLPLENEQHKDILVATKETQDFYLQLFTAWINNYNPDEIKGLIKRRQRATAIFVSSALLTEWTDSCDIYPELILQPRMLIDYELVANKILESQDWAYKFSVIVNSVKATGYHPHVDVVISLLRKNASDAQKQKIKEIVDILVESVVKDEAIIESKKGGTYDEYPFSKTNARISLAKALDGLTDAEEIDSERRRWAHRWHRDRAEYEQKIAMAAKAAKKDREARFAESISKSGIKKGNKKK